MQTIIGLGHTKGVGKDTFAGLLEKQFEKHERFASRIAFADPVYETAENLFGWAGQKNKRHYDANPAEKEIPLPIGRTPREILIGIGAGFREIYPAMWIELLCHRVQQSTDEFTIITDVRYPNEFARIKEMGGLCYCLRRDAAPKTSDPADEAMIGHELMWDGFIYNNGTIEDLDDQAANFVKRLI